MVFGQKRLKLEKQLFLIYLLPITLETTANIIFRLLLPIEKVLENLKF